MRFADPFERGGRDEKRAECRDASPTTTLR